MLWGRKSLLPKVGTTGMERRASWVAEKVSTNLSATKRFEASTSAVVRGCFSSLSWRAESPVQTTKSTLSRRLSVIQSKVALTREKGESQSVVSAPYVPARPLLRWQAVSSSVEEWTL